MCHGDVLALTMLPPAGPGGPRGIPAEQSEPNAERRRGPLASVWATVGGIEVVVRGVLRSAETAIAERSGRTRCVGKNRGCEQPGARRRRALTRSAQAGIYPARDHHLFRLYRHQYPPDDLAQFLPRRDRHGRRPQRLSHRHPRGPRLPAHLRRGAPAAARPGCGHGHRPRRRRGRLLPLCRNQLLRRADRADAHRQRRLPLLAPASGRARSLAGQAGRRGERAGTLPLHRVCRHHRRAAGDAGDPVLRGSHLRRSAGGAGAVVARSLRGDRGLRLCRRAGHLPLSRLRQRARRGPCRAAHHLAQGVQPLLLAELSRRLAHADLFRLRALRPGRAVRRRRAHPDPAAGRLRGDQLADRRLGRQARRSLRREADADRRLQPCTCSSSSASRFRKTSGCST